MEPCEITSVDPRKRGILVEPPGRLSRYSTFQLGGGCEAVWTCPSPAALRAAVERLNELGRPWVLLGGGSNVLISDDGVPAVVVRYCGEDLEASGDGAAWTVPACARLDAVAEASARQGWDGLLCCTGIPGTVGGAVVGNAGAWGEQIADRLVSVRLLRPNGTLDEVAPAELAFGYRRSALQSTRDIVIAATLRLEAGHPHALLAKRADILAARAAKHPDLRIDPCIGSIFRNLEPSSAADRRRAAGWFLEQAGAKDLRVGGARVFEKHANIVVKGPGCTAQQVHDLIDRMADAVYRLFALRLVREVRYLGHFTGEAAAPAIGFY